MSTQGMAAPNESETNEKRVERSILSHLWWRRQLFWGILTTSASTAVTHALYGAPFDTWTLQLHLLTKIVHHSRLPQYDKHASLKGMRAIVSLDKRMPPPKHLRMFRDKVPRKKRGLQGILKDLDEADSLNFEVEAEWTVHDGVDHLRSRVVLFLHGGAYCSMSVSSHRALTLAMSKALSCRMYVVEYGLAPEHPYPEPIYHAVTAYLHLLDIGIPPQNIVFAGDSAGGGLSAATLMYIANNGLPQPAGGILISPWIDLSGALQSHTINSQFDYISRPFDSSPVNPVKYYIGDAKPEDVPYASPVFATDEQLAKLPPLLIQSGGVESLRDESTLFAGRLGPGSRHEIFDHGVHVFQIFVATPAAQAAFAAMAKFEATLTPPEPFDFSEIDAKLSAKKPRADKPPSAVTPPVFSFSVSELNKDAPRPEPQEKACERLKQLTREWKQIPDFAFYAATWDTKPRSLLGSWAHL